MTTKELFENLLAGKKMKLGSWCNDHYIVLAENGLLEERFDGTFIYPDIYSGYLDWQEYKEEILDKKEKEYLSAVIKPFRDKISCIIKSERYTHDKEYITIVINHEEDIEFPYFSKDTMYKGMKTDRNYTLEELGL